MAYLLKAIILATVMFVTIYVPGVVLNYVRNRMDNKLKNI